MPDTAPKIAFALQLPPLLFLLYGVVQLFFSSHDRLLHIAFGLIVIGVSAHRLGLLSTQLTHAGVTQWTWSGRIVLAWCDIAEVSREKTFVVLKGNRRRIRVPVEMYYDSESVMKFLNTHLPNEKLIHRVSVAPC